MKNFKVVDKYTGKEYWISRSMAVAGFIVSLHNDDLYVLLERRGPGCPDNIGKLCGVCGYIDYDETRSDAIIRETYEETGLDLKTIPFKLFDLGIRDDEFDKKQNITQRYLILVDFEYIKSKIKNGEINNNTEKRGGEENEVSEIVFLPYDTIKEMPSNNFAFGHKELIDFIYAEYV